MTQTRRGRRLRIFVTCDGVGSGGRGRTYDSHTALKGEEEIGYDWLVGVPVYVNHPIHV